MYHVAAEMSAACEYISRVGLYVFYSCAKQEPHVKTQRKGLKYGVRCNGRIWKVACRMDQVGLERQRKILTVIYRGTLDIALYHIPWFIVTVFGNLCRRRSKTPFSKAPTMTQMTSANVPCLLQCNLNAEECLCRTQDSFSDLWPSFL